MTEFTACVSRYFGFLICRHGFDCSIESPNHVRYLSRTLYFDVSTDARDGTDLLFGRVGHVGIVPEQSEESISLQTLVDALSTADRTYRQRARPTERILADLSESLNAYVGPLIGASDELYAKLRELRFWHVGHWTREWGTTIRMSSSEIAHNRELLPCIERLLRAT